MSLTKKELQIKEISITGYEKVYEIKEESSGLHALIALHDTTLGPALGGIRVYPYASLNDALFDVLRLSKGMTYKSALAKTGTGGGKSVILLNPERGLTEEMLQAFGDAIESLEGNYIGAEDVGMGLKELQIIRQRTSYLVGLAHPKSSGDPSYFTAHGGFMGVKAVCKKLWNDPSVKGKKIAIQGLGSVGMKLARDLFWEGAELIVTDVDKTKVAEAVKTMGAIGVEPDAIFGVECDIFAPCAMGGILNEKTIPSLKCRAVAGLANNQLLTDHDGEELHKRNILYAPDFAINGGGLINVCVEVEETGYNPAIARDRVKHIYDVLLLVFTIAEERGEAPSSVINKIAEDNLRRGIGKRTKRVCYHH